jgi:hypothetical protein
VMTTDMEFQPQVPSRLVLDLLGSVAVLRSSKEVVSRGDDY